jgi:hypothetical protein
MKHIKSPEKKISTKVLFMTLYHTATDNSLLLIVLVMIASPCWLNNFHDVSTHMLTFVEPGLTPDTVH